MAELKGKEHEVVVGTGKGSGHTQYTAAGEDEA